MALKVLLDTMFIIGILTDPDYLQIAGAVDDERIEAILSVISLTELIKLLGQIDERRTRAILKQLKASKMAIKPVDVGVAEKAGFLRLKYPLPTADSLIGATGIIWNCEHIFTNDQHFNSIRSLLKPMDLARALKFVKKLGASR